MSDYRRKRRGRPLKEGSLKKPYRLMMSDDMDTRLNNLSKMTGKSKADIFREAFNIYENLELARSGGGDMDVYEEEYGYEFDEYDEDFTEDFE